jgi:hypothetical protein
MKLKDVVVDTARAEEGAWVNIIPEMEGLRIKTRGVNNKDWRKLQQRLIQSTPRKRRAQGNLDPEDFDRIMSECLLNHGLLDWDGLEDDDGNPLPYSREKAKLFLTDPDYRRFREAAAFAANQVADHSKEDLEEDAGNLLRLSSGSTDGGRKLKAS